MTDQLAFDLGGGPAPPPPEPADDDGLAEEQRAVVRFQTDLVVTAGAGSGKTRTLVALYREILENPSLTGSTERFGPSRILCLTFTERAARDLARRIRAVVRDERWLRELETASITTFHAWCAELLRRHPLEAGVDPRFSVLTEEAADELLRRAALETLRGGIEKGDEPARVAVEALGLGRAAEKLADLVRALRTAGWPTRAPIEAFEKRIEAAAEEAAALRPAVDAAVDELLDAARRASLRTEGQLAALADLTTAAAGWRGEPSVALAVELAATARSAGRYWRFEASKELRRAVEEAAGRWAAVATEVEGRFQLGVWPALAVTVREAYRRARVARGALDYDDLLLRARDLLSGNEPILAAVRRRYRFVLVDEHQDTDPVQDDLLRLVVGRAALAGDPDPRAPRWCVVGDAQQSIYGFRGATVAAFEELARHAAGRDARRRLAANYRSRPALVDFHNAFFPSVLTGGERADQVAYEPQRAHRDRGPAPAVELLDPGDHGLPAAEAREEEARALAARLAAACDPEGPWSVSVWDRERKEERPAGPGDVVVLFRRLTQVEPYRRALEAAGLESIVVGSGSFYGRQEVFDVLNALEAALHPDDPIPLVGFLRSPMVGLPDDAVWRLVAGADRDGPLRDRLAGAAGAADLDAEEAARLADGLDVLAGLADRADRMPPGGAVGWLVDRTGYAAVLDALPDRAQRRANLERLVALADRAPADGEPLLSQWVSALRRRAERPPREVDATLPEAGDRVRAMSIHQAKGLEFPVVAVADLGGQGRSGLGGVAFDPDLGIVAKVWDDPAADPRPTAGYLAARRAAREREEAEEARLLYVAATRARDHLVLSAGSTGADWLARVRTFAGTPAAGDVLVRWPLEEWRDRFEAALGQAPPVVADPGPAVLDRLPAAPGEVPARALAAALAGGAPEGPPPAAPTAREAAARALRRGARGHAALERVPLPTPEGFDWAAWLTGPGGLPPDEAAGLAPFAARHVAPALGAAAELARERPFRLRLPGGGVVAGAIDALWLDEDGRWWVGDYKFTAEDPAAGARHEAQLAIYALAAAAALGADEVRGRLWYVEEDAVRDFRWEAADLADLERRLDETFDDLPEEAE